LSIRRLFPSIRSTSDETQTSERSYERVSVRHPQGRAPTLHLRLSEFDMGPVAKALRSPSRSPNAIRTHLIPETAPTWPAVEGGYLEVRHGYHRSAPSDVPISPITPNSPWTVTGPTPSASSTSDHTARPRSSTPTRDERLHHPTHTRGDTMSSTMSNLQVEVMTLSESPPDPGFVLPIPSRSWSRQNLYFVSADRLARGSVHSTRITVRNVHSCATDPSDDRRYRSRNTPRTHQSIADLLSSPRQPHRVASHPRMRVTSPPRH